MVPIENSNYPINKSLFNAEDKKKSEKKTEKKTLIFIFNNHHFNDSLESYSSSYLNECLVGFLKKSNYSGL